MPVTSCALTQDYVLPCQDFFGGVNDVYIIEKSAITVGGITAAAGIVTGITKVTTKFFRKYELETHTADAEDALTVSKDNGTRMSKQMVKFPINGMSVSVRNEIEKLAIQKLLIVVVDANGLGWLYGKDYGMRMLSASAKSGVKLADRNGYEFTFEGEEKYQALNVDAPTLLTLQTPGV